MIHKEYCSKCRKEYNTTIEFNDYNDLICDKCYESKWIIIENWL